MWNHIPYYFITVTFPNSVKILNKTNYEDRKESLDLYLAIVNLDLTLRTEKPSAIIDASTEAQRTLWKWEQTNKVCLKVISYPMKNLLDKAYLKVRVLKSIWSMLVRSSLVLIRLRSVSISLCLRKLNMMVLVVCVSILWNWSTIIIN